MSQQPESNVDDVTDFMALEGGLEDVTKQLEDGTEELSIRELYERILVDDDITIVIDAVDEPRIRRGLSSHKSKLTRKLQDNELPPEPITLEFNTIQDDKLREKGRIKLQIYIKRKPTVTIHGYSVNEETL